MQSDSIKNLAAALAEAQAEMPSVPMNSVNPFLKNKFADLGAVINTSRPILAKHGLSISQFPVTLSNAIGVNTILMHNSGEWLSDVITLPLSDEKGKSAAQVAGSIVTYLRRYSWSAILGLYADEDTDGSHPTTNPRKSESTTEAPKQTTDRPYAPEIVKQHIAEKASLYRQEFASGAKKFDVGTRKVLAAALEKIFTDDTQRYEVSAWLTGKASTKDMDPEMVKAMLGWLGVKTFDDLPVPAAVAEANSCHTAALKAQGQMEMPS